VRPAGQATRRPTCVPALLQRCALYANDTICASLTPPDSPLSYRGLSNSTASGDVAHHFVTQGSPDQEGVCSALHQHRFRSSGNRAFLERVFGSHTCQNPRPTPTDACCLTSGWSGRRTTSSSWPSRGGRRPLNRRALAPSGTDDRSPPRKMYFELSSAPRVQTIAVAHSNPGPRRLRRLYGRGRWRKRKGIATVRLADGFVCDAEVHWYEATGIGRRELRVKRLLG